MNQIMTRKLVTEPDPFEPDYMAPFAAELQDPIPGEEFVEPDIRVPESHECGIYRDELMAIAPHPGHRSWRNMGRKPRKRK